MGKIVTDEGVVVFPIVLTRDSGVGGVVLVILHQPEGGKVREGGLVDNPVVRPFNPTGGIDLPGAVVDDIDGAEGLDDVLVLGELVEGDHCLAVCRAALHQDGADGVVFLDLEGDLGTDIQQVFGKRG